MKAGPVIKYAMAETRTPRYRGFCTTAGRGVRTETYDVDLIVQDLLNHFNIVPGEIPGRPGFGCYLRIWCGDPFDDDTEREIREEVIRVIAADPRVKLVGLGVDSDRDNGSIRVAAEVESVETGEQGSVTLTLSSR